MLRLLCLCFLIMGAANGATAQQTTTFDLTIRNIRVGQIILAGNETGKSYAVRGVAKNTGLSRVVRAFSYTGDVNGRIKGQVLTPVHYKETADTGKRVSEVELKYTRGVPAVVRYTSPRDAGPDSPAPSTQGGTVDPLSAIYGLLRDRPADAACAGRFDIFDGKRRSRIRLANGATVGGLPTCTGFYERMQGFLPDEIARHKRFDFVMTFTDAGNGRVSVARVVFDSIYGKAAIDRR